MLKVKLFTSILPLIASLDLARSRSRGDTTFEQNILDNTPCEVVTLDCTLSEPLQTLGPRHK